MVLTVGDKAGCLIGGARIHARLIRCYYDGTLSWQAQEIGAALLRCAGFEAGAVL